MWKGRSPARITRDSVLFVAGLSGIAYETLVTNVDRPTLLILFAGMVGLPAFLRTDEKQAARSAVDKIVEQIVEAPKDGDGK